MPAQVGGHPRAGATKASALARALVEEHGRAGLSRIKDLAEAEQREQDSSRSRRWPSPIVLRHYDLPPDEQRDHHRSGWSLYLERLALCVAGGDPGPDPNT